MPASDDWKNQLAGLAGRYCKSYAFILCSVLSNRAVHCQHCGQSRWQQQVLAGSNAVLLLRSCPVVIAGRSIGSLHMPEQQAVSTGIILVTNSELCIRHTHSTQQCRTCALCFAVQRPQFLEARHTLPGLYRSKKEKQPMFMMSLVLLTLMGVLPTAVASTNSGDTAALRRLYAATGSGQGNCLADTQWGNTSSDPCDDMWFGLWFRDGAFGCSGLQGDPGRRVLAISLSSCSLSGRLDAVFTSDESEQLSNLQALELGRNMFDGPIPDGLSHLGRLSFLDLEVNQLSGPIPDSLGQLSQLTTLVLVSNQLSGPIPDSMAQLKGLELLYLGGNQLSGPIPIWLGELSRLTVLILGQNQLSGPIPDNLAQLEHLVQINLGANRLRGFIPESLGRLGQLKGFSVGHNQLSGQIPSSLGNLTQCAQIILNNNQLSGYVPRELLQIRALAVLDVSWNQLSGPLPPFRGSTVLRLLHFGPNLGLYFEQNTTAVSWLGNSQPELIALVLGGVQVPKGFASSLPFLPKLRTLDISSTSSDDSGTLDVDIATKLPLLVNLFMQWSHLTGPMPALPSGLQGLVAFNNDFTELTPLDSLHNLTYCILDGNRRMTGQLQDDWSAFTKLQVFSVQHCSLSGGIPSGLLELSLKGKLRTIALRDNLLRGPIELPGATNSTRMSSLTGIDIGMNGISGTVPSELSRYLSKAGNLSVLRMDQNLLSCDLSGLWGVGSSQLVVGDVAVLAGNSFQCPVPDSLTVLDAAANTYTCDSAPWQLDMVATAIAALAAAVVAIVSFGHTNSQAACKSTRAMMPREIIYHTATSVGLLGFAFAVSLLHWGVLYPSVYECAGQLWGSGAYHQDANGLLVFVCLFPLAFVTTRPISGLPAAARAECQLKKMTATQNSDAGGDGETSTPVTCLTTKSFAGLGLACYDALLSAALLIVFILLSLGLDLCFVLLASDAWGIRQFVGIPHVITIVTLLTSLMKTIMNVFIIPAATSRVLSQSTTVPTATTSAAVSRRWRLSEGSFISLLRLLLSTLVPLLVALVQFQDCFAYWMPWNTPALLPVEYEYDECLVFCSPGSQIPECQTRAGMPDCGESLLNIESATIEAPPLWRGTCASSAYALFAPQATLMLAIQAAQVLSLAIIQWHTQLTIAELIEQKKRATLQFLRRSGCCTLCNRSPSQRSAWLPQRGKRLQAAPHGANKSGTCTTAPCTMSVGLQLVNSAKVPNLGPRATNTDSTVRSEPAVVENTETSTRTSLDTFSLTPATFDSIQAHISLLTGAVFGAVYPAACLAAAAATGAYMLSWCLAPHAQHGDVPVPRWLSAAMLIVHAASVWFAYGPGSMLDGASADGTLLALIFVSVQTCMMFVWAVAGERTKEDCFVRLAATREAMRAACGRCCSGACHEASIRTASPNSNTQPLLI